MKERGRAEAARQAADERRGREETRAGIQRELDEHWKLLLENDRHTVLESLEAAFADNQAPAAPINCEDGRATVVLLMEGEDLVPERVPSLTPTGRPTTRKLSQTDRNKFYLSWVFSNILVTVKEAFAVAPGLVAVTVVALRQETNPFGETDMSAIYTGTFARGRFAQLDFSRDEVLDAPLYAEEVRLDTKGRTMAVKPPRSGHSKPFTARIVLQLRRAHGLPSHADRLRRAGMLSLHEIADWLGVRPSTIKSWHRAGLLIGHRANDKNERLYEPPTPGDPRLV
ncbi:MAG: hypothetical protein ACT4PO_03420 [Actinomycetota bacterium]